MAKDLGKKITIFEKAFAGCTLMLFVLFLIAGPMILFSSINPISTPNPVARGYLNFYIRLDNTDLNTTMLVNLFSTTQLTQNKTLTATQYNSMDFDAFDSQSNLFSVSQS